MRLQFPVNPALDQFNVAVLADPLNAAEQPAVWLMLKLMVPVKVPLSTVLLMFPASPLLPEVPAQVPVTVVPV